MTYSEPNTLLEINEAHADNFHLVIPKLPTSQFLSTIFNEVTKPQTSLTPNLSGSCDTSDMKARIRREANLDSTNFRMFIKGAVLPDVSIATVELGTQFATLSRASKISFGDLSTTMQVSENLINYQILLFWMYALHNPQEYNKISGRQMINNFFVDIYLIITNNHKEKVAEYKFLDAFPKSLPSLNMNFQTADKLDIDVVWAHSGMFPTNNFVLKYV